MKHDLEIIILIVLFFLLIQIFGLVTISNSLIIEKTEKGNIVEYSETVLGPPLGIRDFSSFVYILSAVLIGSLIVYLIIKYKIIKIWKFIYFFAIWLTGLITLNVFLNFTLALIISSTIVLFEIFRSNVFIHNLKELLIYPGIAVLFTPIFNVFWITLLMIAISIYDIYAVWKSKHMVKFAKFMINTNAFSGFMIPYLPKTKKQKSFKTKETKPAQKPKERFAVLGGGDIAFTLLFSGVTMSWLISFKQLTRTTAFLQVLIIPIITSIILFILLAKGQEDKFYPAMPFLTLGCMIGFLILALIN